MGFQVSFMAIFIMLLYAIPGFILVKTKIVKSDSISAFAILLMYLSQPCLAIDAFYNVEFSWDLMRDLGIFFIVAVVIQAFILISFYFIFKKKSDDVRYRVCTVAAGFGNCSFMGIPLLNALMPDYPNSRIFSIVFFVSMSILGWTLASFFISRDKKYISLKKALINPSVISLIIALIIFMTGFHLPEKLSGVEEVVSLLGKMTTPLCMLIMGMRLATVNFKSLFCDPLQYFTIGIKQIVMPLIGMLAIWFLPLALEIRQVMVIICCCPVATVVLNFTEILGEGQETAANLALLGTILSLITVPIMLLLL